jgi:predicted nucleotidyltransferase
MFSAVHPTTDIAKILRHVRFVPILLQKSKVASVQIFGEISKREAIDDSDSLSRVTEVAYEFSVRR